MAYTFDGFLLLLDFVLVAVPIVDVPILLTAPVFKPTAATADENELRDDDDVDEEDMDLVFVRFVFVLLVARRWRNVVGLSASDEDDDDDDDEEDEAVEASEAGGVSIALPAALRFAVALAVAAKRRTRFVLVAD